MRVEKVGEGTGTVTSSPIGINCDPECSSQQEVLSPGDYTLTAAPNPNDDSFFDGWGEGCEHFESESGVVTLPDQSGITTCRVAFEATGSSTRTLEVVVVGDGRVFANQLDCPGDCSQAYPVGSDVVLTSEDEEGVFDRWEGEGCDFIVGTNNTTVHMDQSRVCTAYFSEVDFYELRVTKDGNGLGRISSQGDAPFIECLEECLEDSEQYPDGREVALHALPINSTFEGWSGVGCDSAIVDVSVDMTQDRECAARFVPEDSVNLHLLVSTDGSGNGEAPSIAVTPGGFVCFDDCNEGYAEGSPLTLTANDDGLDFWHWFCDGTSMGSSPIIQISLDEATTCSANFRCPDFPLCGPIEP